MKSKRNFVFLLALPWFFFAATPLTAAPQVTNLLAQQRTGTKLVDLVYDLADTNGSLLNVSVEVSPDNGATYLSTSHFSGNGYGSDVTTGVVKQIVWDAAADWNGNYSAQVWFRVTADNSTAYNAFIPSGRFTMGDTFNEGWTGETPAHTVAISDFFMDKKEVTLALWTSVYQPGITNGYTFDSTGSGKADNHPVQSVNWYDCVKWCNARSEMEGLTPCYYTSAARSSVYRSGRLDLGHDWVNWSANGYRLPTEAEWEKAARGGAAGRRFAWHDADTINQNRANYFSYWSGNHPYYAYDVNATEGYNPTYAVSDTPYTSPTASFAANAYGLFDMVGNVSEWCWDRYDAGWYNNSGAAQSDTRGPSSGDARVERGGGWKEYARGVRVATRNCATPGYQANELGFRCVRNQLSRSGTTGSTTYGPVMIDTREAGRPVAADFDGDAKADPATVDSSGNWYIWLSARDYEMDGPFALGIAEGSPLAADFDGDSKADPAMVDSSGNWYIWLSSGNYRPDGPFVLGIAEGSSLAADFDGDSKADPAMVDLSGNWYILLSSGNYRPDGPFALGFTDSTPVAGDFDGDSKADPAVMDLSGNWYIWLSSRNYQLDGSFAPGITQDTPLTADLDGDFKSDPILVDAVGNWYVWLSGNNYQPDGPFHITVP